MAETRRETASDRGYSRAEFRGIEKQVQQHRAEWIEAFDRFYTAMVEAGGTAADPVVLAKKAEALADARMEKLEKRFPRKSMGETL